MLPLDQQEPPGLCLHCGTPNPSPSESFCCTGCEFVHQTLTDEGFERFYDLKGKTTGLPVKDRPFQPQDLSWLEKAAEGQTSLTLSLQGVTCIGCVWLIEKLFLRLSGAESAALFPDSGEGVFSWKEDTSPILDLAQELPRFGYALAPLDETKKTVSESSHVLGRLGICGAFAMNAMAFTLPRYLGMKSDFAFAHLFELVTILSATFCLLIGGTYFFTKAVAALRRRTLHLDLPISLGLILAFAGSLTGYFLGESKLLYFDFVAIFTTLMLGGRYFHLAASERARSNLTSTSALPETVTLEDGTKKATRTLATGDTFSLSPGNPLPVTAFLRGDSASLSLAWINGEPEPRTFHAGQRVPSGALSLANQPLTLEADESFSDSLVSKLTQPATRSEASPLLQKVLKVYLTLVLLLGLGGGLTWLLTTGNWADALQVAISVFIVSCPCAIGVAIPLADRRAATHLQKHGVFVQNNSFWHQLTRIKCLLFDKTGTLTLEHPTLSNPEALTRLSQKERATLLHLTSQSLHPLSRTLHQHLASERKLSELDTTTVTDVPGEGLSCTSKNHHYQLGKPLNPKHLKTNHSGPTTTFTRNGEELATFQFTESARPDAARALQATAFPIHILSGDQSHRVRDLATHLQLDPELAHGDLSPTQKASLVEKLNPALFLGDGANDSLAFDAALVTGSPVADRSLLDTKADFLFSQASLSFLPHLFAIARWRHRIVRRILTLTVLYNLVAVALCLCGQMNPLLAAILMPLSSLVTLLIASAPLEKSKQRPQLARQGLELLPSKP